MNEISHLRISKRSRERFLTQSADGKAALQTKYLGVYGCGISELYRPYEMSRQFPQTHAIFFTLAGKGRLIANGVKRELLPGTVCILPANQDHAYGTDGFWHMLWLHAQIHDYWTELMPRTATVIKSLWAERMRVLAEEFLEETLRRDRAAHTHVLEGYANLIALFLRRELNFSERSGSSIHRDSLEQLWQMISANPARNWNIDTLARIARFSRSHLHAVTHRIYGHGVMEMVGKLRMERASNLILNQRLKLADIAEQVGYESPFSFSRAFKRHMGVTPQAYRQNCQGSSPKSSPASK